jgi:hypothetical protein
VHSDGGDLTKQTIGRLARQIAALLEQGKPERAIRQGLADWYASGQNPATFDSFANAALRGRSTQRARSPRRPHQPYQNPPDDSAYEEKL